MPYSNNWGFRPRYGNRYLNYPSTYMGQQQQQPSHGAVLNQVDPNQQAIPQVQAPPQPTFSANEDLAQRDEARDQQRVGQAQAYGYTPQQKSAGDLALGALGLLSPIPGVGTLANTLSQSLQGDDAGKAVQSSNTQGYLGQHDTQGNVYGQDGVGYDPLTGQATNSFASVGSAWDANKNFANNFFTPAEERDDYISPAARQLGVTAASQAGIMNDVGERSIETLLNQAEDQEAINMFNRRNQQADQQFQSTVGQNYAQPATLSDWGTATKIAGPVPASAMAGWQGLQRQANLELPGSVGSFQQARGFEDLIPNDPWAIGARDFVSNQTGRDVDLGDYTSTAGGAGTGNVYDIQADDSGGTYAEAINEPGQRGTILASGNLVQDDQGVIKGSTIPGTQAHQQREESSSEPGGK